MADQFHDNIPALGNTIAADIPDIAETLGFLKDCFEQICNGWSNTDASGLTIKGVTSDGLAVRSQFTHSNDTDIKIGAGYYNIMGDTGGENNVFWDSELTYTFTSLTASTWSYLYIDDSDLGATQEVSASELTDSTTAPTYSHAYHGFYNGEDRCIFAVYADADTDILKFHHMGDYVMWDEAVKDLNDQDIDPTWTAVTLTAPDWGQGGSAEIHHAASGGGGAGEYYTMVAENNSATQGIIMQGASVDQASRYKAYTTRVKYNSSQQVYVKLSRDNVDKMSVWTLGWYFPIGM
jgi:hypothetical protein